MKIKSSKEYYGIIGLLFCCIVAVFYLVLRIADDFRFSSVVMILLSIIVFRYWISVGRTLIMDSEGCTVQFLWFHRNYKWEKLETKCVEDYSNSCGYRDPYIAGALFSEKRIKKPRWLKPAIYSMLVHPFSCFFVYFDPDIQYKKWDYRCPDIYVVDEGEFRNKMQAWSVELE